MKKVQILLSSYNGEKYIREQMDSLLNQDYKNINILIRDDGSTDHTVDILEVYAAQYDFIQLIKGNNIGVVASFFELMKNADLTSDLFSFCDQDDVWKKNKISKAVEKICDYEKAQGKETPILYFSKLTLTDDKLSIIKGTASPRYIGPENAVMQNIVTGCAMVVNKKLFMLCMENLPNVKNVYMHDWWFYLLASFMGQVIFDDYSYVLYRQHGNNALGLPVSFWQGKKRQLRYMFDYKGRALRIAHIHEFWNVAKDKISPKSRELVLQFFNCQKSFTYRCRVSLKMPFRFQSTGSMWKLKLLIILNMY